MRTTSIQIHESRLRQDLLPQLERRVFHVTWLATLPLILKAGAIEPNQDGSLRHGFGAADNSFFRKRGCVSLFDYRTVTPEQLDDLLWKCSPLQNASPDEGIAVLLLGSSIYAALLPWTLWEEEGRPVEMVVPHVEAGHPGPIPLDSVDEILRIEVIDEPDSFASIVRRVGGDGAPDSNIVRR